MNRDTLGPGEFWVMLFVGRAVVSVGLNARYLGGENFLEGILSALLALGAQLLLALPLWRLYRRAPNFSPAETWPIAAAYLVYYLGADAASLGLFQIFLTDCVNPEFSTALVLAALLFAAAFGACRGVETVCRASLPVFAALLLGSGLVLGFAAFHFDPENLAPLFRRGLSQTAHGAVMLFPRTAVLGELVFLLPCLRGRGRAGLFWWTAALFAFLALLLLLLAGSLGPYALTRDFPVYALSGMTEARVVQRLDAVLVGLWMTGLIIKLAAELVLCRLCLAALPGKRRPRLQLFGFCGLILALSWAVVQSPAVQALLLDSRLLCAGALLTGGLLPWVALRLHLRKEASP